MTQYIVSVPATSANLGPGFDAIGLALQLYNKFTFAESEDRLQITVAGKGGDGIPRDARNLVYRAAQRVFEVVGFRPKALKIHIENNLPVASGLGSSSTAIVGGMLGANALAGSPLSQHDVLRLAVLMEGHPDNVMPAILGGLTVGVLDGEELIAEKIELPAMQVVLVTPRFAMFTKEARAVLPKMVAMQDAVFNIGRSALLLRALATGEYSKLRIAMQDRLHQPYRLPLIPGFVQAQAAAYAAGAAGVALSGAGPTLIAFAPAKHSEIAQSVLDCFQTHGLPAQSWILPIDNIGAETKTLSV